MKKQTEILWLERSDNLTKSTKKNKKIAKSHKEI